MCNFFSFISDGLGNFYYADAKLRRSKKFKAGNYEPDSGISLVKWFFKDYFSYDKMNVYGYTNRKFVIYQIGNKNDSNAAKSWINKFVKTEEFHKICLEAVKQHGYIIQIIKEQNPELCLEAVKQSGWTLECVKKQTPEICMEAVKQIGWTLQYVKDQTPELCLAAVKQSGDALRFVKEQTPEICMEAVKQNGYALYYVKDQTPEICLEAVKRDGYALKYVKEEFKHLFE